AGGGPVGGGGGGGGAGGGHPHTPPGPANPPAPDRRGGCCPGRWGPDRCSSGLSTADRGGDVSVDLARDVALETADDLPFGLAFGRAACQIAPGPLIARQPRHGDRPQGVVGLSVAAAVEAVADGLAWGSLTRGGAR